LGSFDEDYDEEDSSLRKIKTVQGVEGRWTVTDADLSRDNEWYVLVRNVYHLHGNTELALSG
jgi:hypothetical protein